VKPPGLILIAASTGGPQALHTVLSGLRGDLPAPVLVVQHIPPFFNSVMVDNLGPASKLRVKLAEDREYIQAGTVYIAPGGRHMILDRQKRIGFDDSPPIFNIRPAADVLFWSVAEACPNGGVLAVILTGMGEDGAQGLTKIKRCLRCICIAQSRDTCVVYGMPRAVIECGLADFVLDIGCIAQKINALCVG